jgi:hypothetical protein
MRRGRPQRCRVNIYTPCTACGLILNVTDPQYTTHPNCEEAPNTLADAYKKAVLSDDDNEIDRLGRILDQPTPPPKLAAAALIYTRDYGWPVFPLRPGSKIPLTRNGFKDATTDLDQVTTWWKNTPHANIGLPTGHAFDVIDVDAPAGWPSYWTMRDNHVIPDVHAVVFTAGAGLHLYIEPTGGGNLAGTLPGIDIRGIGGYVVAPPSQDPRGRYLFRHKPSQVITTRKAPTP